MAQGGLLTDNGKEPGVHAGLFALTTMSPFTRGQETTVTVDFKPYPQGTLMILKHTGLSNDAYGKAHIDGWGYFLGLMEKRFA